MDIVDRIKEAAELARGNYGVRGACQVYLGRNEMQTLMAWAHANCYVSEENMGRNEGEYRPEVAGSMVFEVNTDNHFKVFCLGEAKVAELEALLKSVECYPCSISDEELKCDFCLKVEQLEVE